MEPEGLGSDCARIFVKPLTFFTAFFSSPLLLCAPSWHVGNTCIHKKIVSSLVHMSKSNDIDKGENKQST
jgi:hypothetical protein